MHGRPLKLCYETPAYTTIQNHKETDKLIFTPDGVFPNLIFSNGAIPSSDVTNP